MTIACGVRHGGGEPCREPVGHPLIPVSLTLTDRERQAVIDCLVARQAWPDRQSDVFASALAKIRAGAQ